MGRIFLIYTFDSHALSMIGTRLFLMSFKIESVTLIPALALVLIAIFLSFFSVITIDSLLKERLLWFALSCFIGGVMMVICWILYQATRKRLP